MMKKIYIAPAMDIAELEVAAIIAGSVNTGGSLPGTGDGGDDDSGNLEADANGRRGSWGNLWEDNKRW